MRITVDARASGNYIGIDAIKATGQIPKVDSVYASSVKSFTNQISNTRYTNCSEY